MKLPMEDAAFADAVSAHVQQVEQILGGEQAQWGQLIGEIKADFATANEVGPGKVG